MNIAAVPFSTPPRQVLIVEDEILIAWNVAMQVEEFGHDIIGPAASVKSALELLEYTRPDAALLDVNLGRELVTPVASRLQALSIPYVLTTAYALQDLPKELLHADMIQKPMLPELLKSALDGMLAVHQPN